MVWYFRNTRGKEVELLIALALALASSPPPTRRDVHLRMDSRCRIALDRGRVSLDRLHAELKRLHRYRPEPDLHFQPSPDTPYECVDRVLTVIRRSEITKMGFIGNESYTEDPPATPSPLNSRSMSSADIDRNGGRRH